jgi:hypothetical protein
MAGMQANQVVQRSVRQELERCALLGPSAKGLAVEFYHLLRSSNLSIAGLL